MTIDVYSTKRIRKQFKGMSRVMAAILRGKTVEGPIRIALIDDEGSHVMTLTLEKS